ncbi:MAG: hypothetical protein U1F68_20285 [Gammaproteobacteria bacterium]
MIMPITLHPIASLFPMAIWAGLDGRAFYADALTLAGGDGRKLPAILAAIRHRGSWYALPLPLVVFLSGCSLAFRTPDGARQGPDGNGDLPSDPRHFTIS